MARTQIEMETVEHPVMDSPDSAENVVAAFSPVTLANANGQHVSISTLSSWSQLEGLIAAWERILKTNAQLSIFSTPEWLGAWWKTFGAGKQMIGLTFSNGHGVLVGLILLYLEESQTPIFGKLRTLRLVGDGSGDSDGLDLIVQPGYEKACAEAFVRWLKSQRNWDICRLDTITGDSVAAKALVSRLRQAKWPMAAVPSACAAIPLPRGWKEYVESLAPEFRPLVTRYPRRLASRYPVQIMRCERVSDLPAALETLFSLHQQRWQEAGQSGSFASAQRREFYRQMAEAFLTRGWLELWHLDLNGKSAAIQFCFRYRERAYILQEGFDPKFASEKVGYALRGAMLQHFISLGTRCYDFLGGFAAHKQKWGAQPAEYLNLRFALPNGRGSRALSCEKLAGQTKEWLRNNLPAPAWNLLHRVNLALHPSTEPQQPSHD